MSLHWHSGDAQKRANEKYRKEKAKHVAVRFYPGDQELYEFLKAKENVAGYIKKLIRADMEREA